MQETLSKGRAGHCYARTYAHKALLSILVFPTIIALGHIGLSRGGATYLDVPYLIYSGQLIWWKQAVSWSCLVVGVLRYYPPSWKALRHGMCAIARDSDDLVLSGVTRLPISDVVSIKPVSSITKKGIIIQASDGQAHYVCSILTDLNNPKVLAKRILADCSLTATITVPRLPCQFTKSPNSRAEKYSGTVYRSYSDSCPFRKLISAGSGGAIRRESAAR